MWAIVIPASAQAMGLTHSLASLRQGQSEAKVRWTTQRRGNTSKPSGLSERLTRSIVHRTAALQLLSRIAAIGKDVTEPGRPMADEFEQGERTVPILNVRAMHG